MKDMTYLALLDIYGKALTDKQRSVLTDYYERDFSLSEIASNTGISRQAVHFTIKQAEKSLRDYESYFGVRGFVTALCEKLNEIKSQGIENRAAEKIAELEEFIRSNYGTVWQP